MAQGIAPTFRLTAMDSAQWWLLSCIFFSLYFTTPIYGNLDLGECHSRIQSGEYATWLGSTDTRCNCSQCDAHMNCCSHSGIVAKLAAFETSTEWLARLEEFNSCTGAMLSVEYPADEDNMESYIKSDVGVGNARGAEVYDAYVVQAPWIPSVNQRLMDWTPWIRNTSGLSTLWNSVNVASRQATTVGGVVRAIPLDTDYIALGYRADVFRDHNISEVPQTIDDLVELSERLNGLDHNGDGIPDWGFCLTPQPNYFYAFVAPILQANGCNAHTSSETCDNMFFDTRTFQPLIDNPGFERAVKLYHRFLRASNCHVGLDPATPGYCNRKTAFPTGRCAGVISMPGTMTKLLGAVESHPYTINTTMHGINVTGLEGLHWGRRALFPGSRIIYDRATQTLRNCTSTVCPKASVHESDGSLINFAPYFSEGGEAYSVRATAGFPQRGVIKDFLLWLSTRPLNELPLSGQYSYSQLEEPKASEFRTASVSDGWPEIMVDDLLLRVLPKIFDRNGNQAQDLLIVGFSEYMRKLDMALHDNFLLHVNLSVSSYADRFAQNDPSRAGYAERYSSFISGLNEDFDSVTRKYGRLNQLRRWRASLNLPEYSDARLCAEGNLDDPECPDESKVEESDMWKIVLCVSVPVIVISLLIVTYWRSRSKRLENMAIYELGKIREAVASEVNEKFAMLVGVKGVNVSRYESLRVSKDCLECGSRLGKGAFGVVFKGRLKTGKSQSREVAIKMLNATSTTDQKVQEAFLFEARLMSILHHPFIVKVEAVYDAGTPLMMALELLPGGDLLSVLRGCTFRDNVDGDGERAEKVGFKNNCTNISVKDKVVALSNISSALNYLHNFHIVHRDIAARNILVSADGIRDVRVADFGLSRRMKLGSDYYQKHSDDKIPLKWMPLESIQHKRYSTASDVWSFGVLAWEVFSGGQTPWAYHSAVETALAVAQGQRLAKPKDCPDFFYDIMMACWRPLPDDRVTMRWIHTELQFIVNQKDASCTVLPIISTDNENVDQTMVSISNVPVDGKYCNLGGQGSMQVSDVRRSASNASDVTYSDGSLYYSGNSDVDFLSVAKGDSLRVSSYRTSPISRHGTLSPSAHSARLSMRASNPTHTYEYEAEDALGAQLSQQGNTIQTDGAQMVARPVQTKATLHHLFNEIGEGNIKANVYDNDNDLSLGSNGTVQTNGSPIITDVSRRVASSVDVECVEVSCCVSGSHRENVEII